MNPSTTQNQRLHALDAVRGFALLLGVAFHAALSFMPGTPPGLWAMVDRSSSPFLSDAAFVTHIFRMSLFFFIAGYFGRQLYRRLGARGFWSNRLQRILVPLIAGWVVLFPIIAFIWTLGLNKVLAGATLPAPPPTQEPGAFPLTHLWFLYQLLLIYVGVIAVRAVVARLDRGERLRLRVDRVVAFGLRTPIAVLTLGLPLAAVLMKLHFWIYWLGIPSPDRSLIPQLPASVGFGTAFAFGWLVHRSRDGLAAIARYWPVNLVLGAIATGFLLRTVHAHTVAEPGPTKTAFAFVFGVAVWAWVLGLTGAALRFLSNYSAVRRYLADASYWIYLAHLPVVAALQVWVGDWPLGWGIKYPFILVSSLGALLASYHVLVRPTFLGQLLNGRRIQRGGADGIATVAAPAQSAAALDGGPVARLHGVVKRYGANTALAGVEIAVRGGELLAVLGPNGAGKTTAIALWLGLIEPDAGDVSLLGGSPQDINRRRRLGVMMQDVDLVKELRVRELIALAASYYPDPMSIDEVLRVTQTAAIAHRPYGKLSGGQKRQVQFAAAICGRPKVLFLDEPTVGLDVQAREALWANVRALLADGCSVVLTTHYMEEAEALATRVVVLAGGRVIATGSVDEMRALVARRQITCESELAAEEVRGWSGVTAATRDGKRLTITATDAEGVVRRLLTADATLRRLEVREAGLSEAFNELTREAA